MPVIATVLLALTESSTKAELVLSPKTVTLAPQRACFELEITNQYDAAIAGARAHMFVFSSDGTVVARQARWLWTNNDPISPLNPGEMTRYWFAVGLTQEVLRAELRLNKVLLADGRVLYPGTTCSWGVPEP